MGERQYVLFKLAKNELGIPIESVREVIRTPEITGLPGTSAFIKGIINLRNQIIPIIDLAEKLSIHKTMNEENRIIVVNCGERVLGIIVDGVTEVIKVDEGNVERRLNLPGRYNRMVDGIIKLGDRLIILVLLEELLDNMETIAWNEGVIDNLAS